MVYMPFWRKGTLVAHNNRTLTVYTKPLVTTPMVEIVLTLRIDMTFVFQNGPSFDVTPQVSNDGINWEDVTPVFSPASGPTTETIQWTTLGRFARCKLELADGGPMNGLMGLLFSLLGDGKVNHVEMEPHSVFIQSFFGNVLGGPSLLPGVLGMAFQSPNTVIQPPGTSGPLPGSSTYPSVAPQPVGVPSGTGIPGAGGYHYYPYYPQRPQGGGGLFRQDQYRYTGQGRGAWVPPLPPMPTAPSVLGSPVPGYTLTTEGWQRPLNWWHRGPSKGY